MSDDIQTLGTLNNMWLVEPDWSGEIQSNFIPSYDLIQCAGSVGALWVNDYDAPRRIQYQYRNATKAEEKALLDFFEARLGRHGCFWMPTWMTDFVVINDIATSDTVINVKNNAFSSVCKGYERIAFILTSGDIIVRKISAATYISIDQENITLTTSVDRVIATTDIALCCLFLLVRFEKDNLQISYTTDSVSDVEFNVYELIKEYP